MSPEELRLFARVMREEGVTDFTDQNGFSIKMAYVNPAPALDNKTEPPAFTDEELLFASSEGFPVRTT